MKIIIKINAFIFAFLLAFSFSACALGSYSVSFVDYKGNFLQERVYSNGEAVTNTNAPSAPSRVGFSFYGWEDVQDETLQNNFSTDRVMQATYTINLNDSYFQQSGRKLMWYGTKYSSELSISSGQKIWILISDIASYSNFSNFTITNAEGSSFAPAEIIVYDNNGKVCNNNSIMWGEWVPDEFPLIENYNFIVEITAALGGEAIISLS